MEAALDSRDDHLEVLQSKRPALESLIEGVESAGEMPVPGEQPSGEIIPVVLADSFSGLSLRWVVNGLEFGRSLRCLRDTLLRRVPTSWAVPGGSADGEDRLGC